MIIASLSKSDLYFSFFFHFTTQFQYVGQHGIVLDFGIVVVLDEFAEGYNVVTVHLFTAQAYYAEKCFLVAFAPVDPRSSRVRFFSQSIFPFSLMSGQIFF